MNSKLSKPVLGFILLLAISVLGCKTAPMKNAALPTPGLFKVTILYANGEGKTFDMAYYEAKHMPMMAAFIGDNLKYYEIDKGLSGRTTEEKPPFLAIGYFYISDIAAYNQAIAQNRDAIIADIKNYTNIQPAVQISEIVDIQYGGKK